MAEYCWTEEEEDAEAEMELEYLACKYIVPEKVNRDMVICCVPQNKRL